MTLRKDLERLRPDTESENPYHRFNLLKNPFPGYGEPPTEVCTDQNEVKDAFIERLRDFDTGNKRLRINGESGAGKTNILKYFERLTDEARTAHYIQDLHPIYVSASGEDYFAIHEQIIERLLEHTFADLLVFLHKARSQQSELARSIPSAAEVINALLPIINSNTLFPVFLERDIDTFQRWFKGQKTSIQDKKILHLTQDISSASLAIKFLEGYLELLKHLNICYGIVLLIDEFEQLFVTLSRAKQSRYVQDIRNLMDTLDSQAFFVFATTPEPRDLAHYPAVERRMGETVMLQPIENLESAIEYVVDYLQAGREMFERELSQDQEISLSDDDKKSLAPLSEERIRSVFEDFQRRLEGSPILPGYFLPEIRRVTKELVEGGA